MKVKDLITMLEKLESNVRIYQSSDNEGNSFHDIEEIYQVGKEAEGGEAYIIFPKHTEL